MNRQEEKTAILTGAMGACVSAWANVEFHMSMIFRLMCGAHWPVADAILAAPRSYEVRALIVHNVMRIRLEGKPKLDDWNLLYNYMHRMAGKRNEVAHATLMIKEEQPVLEPYFVMSQERPKISLSELLKRAGDIQDLAHCLMWFHNSLLPTIPLEEFSSSEPDLLLRLRAEDAARREAQRAQRKPSDPK